MITFYFENLTKLQLDFFSWYILLIFNLAFMLPTFRSTGLSKLFIEEFLSNDRQSEQKNTLF